MQLPKNTVPSEPNFLAPFLPAASLSSADADALTSVSRSSSEGKFDQLFDGLKPSTKAPAAQTPAELAAHGVVVCPMPFIPLPPADPEVTLNVGPAQEENVSDVVADSISGESPFAGGNVGQATGNATREARTAMREAKAAARAHDSSVSGQSSATRDHAAPAINHPNDHAAAAALQIPRFRGLTEAALEHRNVATLPPGLTRLLAIHAPTASTRETSVDPVGVDVAGATGVSEVSDIAETEETTPAAAAFGSQLTWPGASAKNHAMPFPGSIGARGPLQLDAKGETSVEEQAASRAHGAASDQLRNLGTSGGHAYGRELELGLPRGVDEHQGSESSTPSADSNNHAPLSSEIAQLLNRVSPKRDFPEDSTMAAKIADALERTAGAVEEGAEKSFVTTDKDMVAHGRKHVGTDAAKHGADMFSRFLPASAQPTASDYAASVVGGLENAPDAAHSGEATPVGIASTAHEAVEVVLRAVDHAASQEQKSVNLRFSVGDMDLSVRVELHASQVRTTFRTDSAELRAALSQEWEALSSSQPGDRTLKLVPAFVTASEQSNLNSFSGDSSSRQRDERAEREPSERPGRVTTKSHGPVTANPVASLHAGAPGNAPLTSRRLHTIA